MPEIASSRNPPKRLQEQLVAASKRCRNPASSGVGGCQSVNFGISPFPAGVLAWSRILNDSEVLLVANTNTTQAASIDLIVEVSLSTPGDQWRILYSNNSAPAVPAPVRTLQQV